MRMNTVHGEGRPTSSLSIQSMAGSRQHPLRTPHHSDIGANNYWLGDWSIVRMTNKPSIASFVHGLVHLKSICSSLDIFPLQFDAKFPWKFFQETRSFLPYGWRLSFTTCEVQIDKSRGSIVLSSVNEDTWRIELLQPFQLSEDLTSRVCTFQNYTRRMLVSPHSSLERISHSSFLLQRNILLCHWIS